MRDRKAASEKDHERERETGREENKRGAVQDVHESAFKSAVVQERPFKRERSRERPFKRVAIQERTFKRERPRERPFKCSSREAVQERESATSGPVQHRIHRPKSGDFAPKMRPKSTKNDGDSTETATQEKEAQAGEGH